MADKIVIDDVLFAENCRVIRSAWKANREAWGNADILCFIQGQIDVEVLSYSKSNTSQVYLFGIEFPETAVLFTENGVYIITSENKARNYLTPMMDKVIEKHALDCETKIFTRKRNAPNDSIYEELKTLFSSSFSGGRLGLFLKEKDNLQGKFITEFFNGMKDCALEEVDMSLGMSAVFAVKNSSEQEKVTRAGITCRRLMKNVFIPDLEDISKNDRRVKHSKIADKIEKAILTPEKYNLKYEGKYLDICHQPIIQSGGVYNLKPSAVSNDNYMKQDIVICSIGIRYDNYCASLARTFFINPSIYQQKCYAVLTDIESEVIKRLVPGAVLGTVYDRALSLLNERAPDLIDYFTKECGVSIGLEFRESTLRIKSGNNETVKAGMCFNVRLGVENVPNHVKESEKNVNDLKTFSILLSDTVIIGEPQDEPVMGLASSSNHLVTNFSTEWSNVSFDLDIDDVSNDNQEAAAIRKLEESGRRVTRGMVRAEQRQLEMINDESSLLRRAKHQEKLRQELVERKIKEAAGIVEEDTKEVDVGEINAFPSPAAYPPEMKSDQIYVDTEHEVIFVPIHGVPVPFSVHTVKTVSMTEDGGYGYFRINFNTPQGKAVKDINPVMLKAFQDYPAATYIRNLTFRSRDQTNMNIQVKRMKNMMKQRRQQDRFKEESADIVEQGQLQLLTNARPPYLSEIDMRPQLGKVKGRLEAHVNGFRYTTRRGEIVDILYSNIKHAVFQPCDQTRFVILHFHLRNPIMIGRKKCRDVQFYTEVIDPSKNLKGISTNAYDPEEILEEQRERETIRRLNEAFRKFTQQCDKVYFDMPYLKSSFLGRPFKEMVMLSPCRDCLINVTELPSLIVTLDEVEHVHFQRVNFSTSTVDMIIIFKDYKKPVVEIDAVKVTDMDKIKEWLDSIDLTFSESVACFDWKALLDNARSDPFFWKNVDEEGNPKPVGWDVVNDEYIQEQMGEKEEDDDNFSDEINPSDLEDDDDDESESMDEEEDESNDASMGEEDYSDVLSLSDM